MQFFREYYPTNEEFVTLECVWEADKFVLLERIKKIKMKNLDGDPREDVSLGTSTIQYQSIEALLAGEQNNYCSLFPFPSLSPCFSLVEKSVSALGFDMNMLLSLLSKEGFPSSFIFLGFIYIYIYIFFFYLFYQIFISTD